MEICFDFVIESDARKSLVAAGLACGGVTIIEGLFFRKLELRFSG